MCVLPFARLIMLSNTACLQTMIQIVEGHVYCANVHTAGRGHDAEHGEYAGRYTEPTSCIVLQQ
jgi:hypothetical protein